MRITIARLSRLVREAAADHVSGAVGGNIYAGHVQDEAFDGDVRKKHRAAQRLTTVDDSAVGEGVNLLRALVEDVVTAQHTVYHTAPVYEDDAALDDVDEMSAGGVSGAAADRGSRAGSMQSRQMLRR